jgi:hypothetical protein
MPDHCRFAVTDLSIGLTSHAVDRFQERVRPGLSHEQAEEELGRLIRFGEVSSAPPRWLADTQRQRAAFYLLVGDIVLPLDPHPAQRERLQALTCLVAGGISEAARERRNSLRARRRSLAYAGA